MIRRRGEESSGIDVSAFADIAFLLIIFFILTTTFLKTAGNRMEIPSGKEDPQQAEEKNLTVNLSENQIRYGEKAEVVTIEELRDRLLAKEFKTKDPSDRIVILDSGPEVPYQLYFDVVVAITDADGVLALLDQQGKEEKK